MSSGNARAERVRTQNTAALKQHQTQTKEEMRGIQAQLDLVHRQKQAIVSVLQQTGLTKPTPIQRRDLKTLMVRENILNGVMEQCHRRELEFISEHARVNQIVNIQGQMEFKKQLARNMKQLGLNTDRLERDIAEMDDNRDDQDEYIHAADEMYGVDVMEVGDDDVDSFLNEALMEGAPASGGLGVAFPSGTTQQQHQHKPQTSKQNKSKSKAKAKAKAKSRKVVLSSGQTKVEHRDDEAVVSEEEDSESDGGMRSERRHVGVPYRGAASTANPTILAHLGGGGDDESESESDESHGEAVVDDMSFGPGAKKKKKKQSKKQVREEQTFDLRPMHERRADADLVELA